jgi:hypothetical protein
MHFFTQKSVNRSGILQTDLKLSLKSYWIILMDNSVNYHFEPKSQMISYWLFQSFFRLYRECQSQTHELQAAKKMNTISNCLLLHLIAETVSHEPLSFRLPGEWTLFQIVCYCTYLFELCRDCQPWNPELQAARRMNIISNCLLLHLVAWVVQRLPAMKPWASGCQENEHYFKLSGANGAKGFLCF